MLEQLLPPSTYFKKSCFLNFHNKRLGLVSWPCRYHQIWFKKQAAQFKFLLAEFLKFITDRSRHCKKPGIFLDRNSCCWFLHCPPRFVILVNEILLDVCSRASAWAIEILFRWTWSRSLNKYIWRQHNWAMWNLRLYSLNWNFGEQTSLITLQQYTVQGVQLKVSAPAEITKTVLRWKSLNLMAIKICNLAHFNHAIKTTTRAASVQCANRQHTLHPLKRRRPSLSRMRLCNSPPGSPSFPSCFRSSCSKADWLTISPRTKSPRTRPCPLFSKSSRARTWGSRAKVTSHTQAGLLSPQNWHPNPAAPSKARRANRLLALMETDVKIALHLLAAIPNHFSPGPY